MVRMTLGQASLFERRARGAATGKPQFGAKKPRVQRKAAELPENIVKDQILDFLKAYGWRVIRNHVGTFTPYRMLMILEEALGKGANMGEEIAKAKRHIVKIGEKGDPDWRAEKPIPGSRKGSCLSFYVEFKRPGNKPDPEQLQQIERLNATGTLAVWVDSFDSGRKPFLKWYRSNFAPDLPLSAAERADLEF